MHIPIKAQLSDKLSLECWSPACLARVHLATQHATPTHRAKCGQRRRRRLWTAATRARGRGRGRRQAQQPALRVLKPPSCRMAEVAGQGAARSAS